MKLDTKYEISANIFGKVYQKSGNWHTGRQLPSHLLIYCLNGEISMCINDSVYTVKQGDVMVIPKNTFYIPIGKSSCEYYFFHFKAKEIINTQDITIENKDVRKQDVEEGEAGYIYYYPKHQNTIIDIGILNKTIAERAKRLIFRSESLKPEQNYTHQLLLNAYIREILIMISKDYSNIEINRKLKEICNYIEQNYSKPLTLSLLANKFSLADSYLARLFQKELKKKPSNYISEIRIEHACKYLALSDLNITEIAEKVGFSDVYYFSKTFKKQIGITPSEYRRNNYFDAV